jgi:hypothetical protein
MCRLFALSSNAYESLELPLKGLAAMREGYDGSGVGMLMKDLGGPFEDFKNAPVLSGIFSYAGLKRLDACMMAEGFLTKYKIAFKLPKNPPPGTPKRDVYLVRAYDYPEEWEGLTSEELHTRLMMLQVKLKKLGEANRDMFVFAFWPDTIMIKEVGDPLQVAEYLGLNRQCLKAKIILVQGRQNTNHQIDLYACHPFFLQGFATMTNGENTAFWANREFLLSRGFAGYNGYMSDSEVFTHTLHYTSQTLALGIECYKHIITPLMDDALAKHPDAYMLKNLKQACRHLIIDGPNCVIGCLPDNTLFMVQDRKKLRPGVVGRSNGILAMSSEVCGLDAVIPDRDKSKDFQPMHLDTVIYGPDREELNIARQTDPLYVN